MATIAVLPQREPENYDHVIEILDTEGFVSLCGPQGTSIPLSRDLMDVLRQGAEILARGKAVVVAPQSMQRFG